MSIVSFFDQFPQYNGQRIDNLTEYEIKDLISKAFAESIELATEGSYRLDLVTKAATLVNYLPESERQTYILLGASTLQWVNTLFVNDARNNTKSSTSCVYFAKRGKRVKIGVTNDIKKRLSTLQVASPQKLEVIAIIKGGKDLEKSLHEKFKEDRIAGEWFRYSKAIEEYVNSI